MVPHSSFKQGKKDICFVWLLFQPLPFITKSVQNALEMKKVFYDYEEKRV